MGIPSLFYCLFLYPIPKRLIYQIKKPLAISQWGAKSRPYAGVLSMPGSRVVLSRVFSRVNHKPEKFMDELADIRVDELYWEPNPQHKPVAFRTAKIQKILQKLQEFFHVAEKVQADSFVDAR